MSNYRKNPSKHTVIFPYTDRFSVRASSINDVNISYKNNIIGKSNKVARPYPGDRTLVVGKKPNGVYIFATESGQHIQDDRVNTWYNQGGNLWDHNYEISKSTEPVFLTWEEVSEITKTEGMEMKKIFIDMFHPKKDGSSQLGFNRDIIFEYLKKHQKNT